MRSGRSVPRFAVGGLAACAAWWVFRHQRSAAVAVWSPGRGGQVRAGSLCLRTFGTADPLVLLLHGMLASGNSFGAEYDRLAEVATVVVPDLLGFGGSMAVTGRTDAVAHLQALDTALSVLGLDRRQTVVAGHSMGGALALRWAASHTDRVRAVVAFGAPLYRDRVEADVRVAAMGRMEALLSTDGRLPRAVCAWMCRHRTVASWIAVAGRPDLPLAVARSGVQHTWATYRGAMDGLIRDTRWPHTLGQLCRAGIPVTLVAGAFDSVPVAGLAAELAVARASVTAIVHPTADHLLPLTDPAWCARLIMDAVDSGHASGG